MKETLVLYPFPAMGHLVSMVELGKLFLTHGFAVAVITVNSTYTTGAASSTETFMTRMSSAHPFLSFHRLPSVSLPPNASPHHEAHAFDLFRLSNPHLLSLLSSLSQSSPVRALIVDFFCTIALDVAAELAIPSYIFFTSSAASLAAFLHLPALHSKVTTSFKDLGDSPLHFPGLPPIPARDMPLPMLDRDDEAYKGFVALFNRMPDADGIIVNTFVSLEPRPLQAIAGGLAVPGKKAPPVHCVGPLIAIQPKLRHDCLDWLDKQPQQSVVFLCFGSLGAFSAKQLHEIAIGLEKSQQKFLWVVRSPPNPVAALAPGGGESAKLTEAPLEPELEALLPEGFLDRTGERGLVVKSWAPQAEVLRHGAVGGFVTHCGWNSVLEAIVGGVAMVAWPLYAEQRMNKLMLVEMGLAVEMRGYESGAVEAAEVEERVKGVVEAEWGREVRGRMEILRLAAEAAMADGGSSSVAVKDLVSKWKAGRR
ncbi:UDP-glycosyltransferase 88B1 [Dendrobium catenatum]|uniref:Anthocyanidin 5,3-O-glucosyltransferase n=1 Tax=Dendrobium catenatum TaxID=906689 RepID=A0A2I0VNC2_9ASPA|nr:UDP-glycosyltransferase 88B1 [Dendrobium catenatum]PKU64909.1 Anthocyanidin 5,3-O-glucosyltransferase [Dendrobium catenatum]